MIRNHIPTWGCSQGPRNADDPEVGGLLSLSFSPALDSFFKSFQISLVRRTLSSPHLLLCRRPGLLSLPASTRRSGSFHLSGMKISVSSAARSLLTGRGREEQRGRDDRRSRRGADQRMTCRCWCCCCCCCLSVLVFSLTATLMTKKSKKRRTTQLQQSVSTSTLTTTQRPLRCRPCTVSSKNGLKITVSKRNNNTKTQ